MSKVKRGITAFGTARTFLKEGTCSETLMNVLDRAFGHPMKLEERGAIPFAGGIVQHGYQCGMLWGAALAAGAQAYRLHGPEPRAETAAVAATQRLVQSFHARNKSINCLEITDTDWHLKSQMFKFFLTGGPIGCVRMAVSYAQHAYAEIDSAFSEEQPEAPCTTPNCAALVARKMGASDEHAVMAAGFAGGIGLSGGACGALGAAIWIIAMKNPDEEVFFNAGSTQVGDVIERFLKCTDHEFECSRIVGRTFESIDDHATHVLDGGCSQIIETLAAS